MALGPRKPCKGKPDTPPVPPPVTDPSPDSLGVTPGASSIAAGSSTPIVVQLRLGGNPLARAGVAVTLSTSGGALSAYSGATDVNGRVTVTLLAGNTAGGSIVVTAHTSSLTGNSGSIAVTSAAAVAFRVTVSNAAPLQNTAIDAVAQAIDTFGNNVAQAGLLTNWTKTGTGGSFAGGATLTNSSGQTTQSFTVANDPLVNHTITATSGSITGTSPVVDVTPPVVIPPPEPNVVLDWAGPTILKADMPVGLAWYDTKLETYGNAQYDGGTIGADVIPAYGAAYDAGNSIAVYERPLTFYVEWVRTGDIVWKTRADAMVLDYYNRYLLIDPSNPYNASPHFAQPESLYMYYLLNGDERMKTAAVQIAMKFWGFWAEIDNLTKPWLEGRVQTRVMMSNWVAEKLVGVGTPTGFGDGSTFTGILDDEVNRVLAMQSPDGSWRFPISTCGESLTYQAGMLSDLLTRLYDKRPKAYNPAILSAMTNLGNYLWTQWREPSFPGDKSFNYLSGLCMGTGSPTSSPDLNGFVAPLYAWLGKRTGDTAWFDKADDIIDGMQAGAFYLYRQYSEEFTSSYRALGYRYGP